APVESMMPLRLAKYGVPLAETAPAGLAAAGIEKPIRTAGEEGGTGSAAGLTIGHQRTQKVASPGERWVAVLATQWRQRLKHSYRRILQ
ncbi:hypothetical protein ABZ905_26995, partial [Streptomyces parvus]